MTKQELATIRGTMTVLPDKFGDSDFYNRYNRLYCWWGWLAKRLGHDAADEKDPTEIWEWLGAKFGLNLGLATKADEYIRTGHTPDEVNKYMLDYLESKVA